MLGILLSSTPQAVIPSPTPERPHSRSAYGHRRHGRCRPKAGRTRCHCCALASTRTCRLRTSKPPVCNSHDCCRPLLVTTKQLRLLAASDVMNSPRSLRCPAAFNIFSPRKSGLLGPEGVGSLASFAVAGVLCLFETICVLHRGFTFQLMPDADPQQVFRAHAGVCRLVWILTLEQRSSDWRQFRRATGKSLNFYTQASELTDLGAEIGFVKAFSTGGPTAEAKGSRHRLWPVL